MNKFDRKAARAELNRTESLDTHVLYELVGFLEPSLDLLDEVERLGREMKVSPRVEVRTAGWRLLALLDGGPDDR